jgi:hypothetical protein
VDTRKGAGLAIEFLRDDPPLLFRMTVVDKIEDVLGRSIGYRIDEPFDSPDNQKAVAKLAAAASG